jgi:uncharacterized protein (TIRG00374 family)
MRVRAALLWLLLLSALYVGGLAWVDSERDLVTTLRAMGPSFATMAGLTMVSWLIRFGRWQWLLRRIGFQPPPALSLAAYLSGFAFTATPGKVGELARIRYYEPLGVKAPDVVAAFVYERVVDLMCVLLLASFSLAGSGMLPLAAGFVSCVCAVVALFATRPSLLTSAGATFRRRGLERMSTILDTLSQGLRGCNRWLTPADVLVAVGTGLTAWSLLSMSLGVLTENLGIALSPAQVMATYPLAMLVGAASMMPGGVGSTEAVIVLVLVSTGVTLAQATTVAIGVRLTTLWFAITVGFFAVAMLEVRQLRGTEVTDRPGDGKR